MNHEASDIRDPLAELAEAFLERYRRGDRPSLPEYCSAYPELAARIREVFPTLVMMEELAPREGEAPSLGGAIASAMLPQLSALADYRILREVGRGGMGVVYEAEQVSLGRRVALKVLPLFAGRDPTTLERFRREARAAARLHHTNIVPVFEVGCESDVWYYAMQFIHGQGLDQVLVELRRLRRERELSKPADANQPLDSARSVAFSLLTGQLAANPQLASADPQAAAPQQESAGASHAGAARDHQSVTDDELRALPASADLSSVSESSPQHYYRRVARIGVQVADALAYAHSRDVLHRDIKPSNLLLDLAGIVWVTDFGLAKAATDSDWHDALTHTGDVVGTLRYMPPERLRGVSDPRSDVYGLGTTLYELLTLRPPYESADRVALLHHVTNTEPPLPRKIDPRIPRDLETIVVKAMNKEASRRYQDAASLADDLRRFLGDRPIDARPATVWERTFRWCRRNPALASLMTTVALLLVIVAAVSLTSLYLVRSELTKTINAEKAERDAKADALDKLGSSYLAEAWARQSSRGVGQRYEGLQAVTSALRLLEQQPNALRRDELRDAAAACLMLPDVRRIQHWPAPHRYNMPHFDLDARGQCYALYNGQGKIDVHRLSDHRLLHSWNAGGDFSSHIALSPDGRYLAATHGMQLDVWYLNHATTPRRQLHLEHIRGGTFTPDSRQLVVIRYGEGAFVYDLATAREIRRLGNGTTYSALNISPDGQRVALAYGERVQIVRTSDGTLLSEVKQLGAIGHVGLPVDPHSLLVDSERRSLGWYDVSSGELVHQMPHQGGGMTSTFSNDGRLLLTHSWWNSGMHLWDTVTGDAWINTSWTEGPMRTRAAEDGSIWLLTHTGNEFELSAIEPVKAFRSLVSPTRRSGYLPHGISTGCDGRVLAVGTSAGLSLWDLQTGEEIALLQVGQILPRFDDRGALWTRGQSGLVRWPLTWTPSESDASPPRLEIATPEIVLHEEFPINDLDVSRDGRIQVLAEDPGCRVITRVMNNDDQIAQVSTSVRQLGDLADVRSAVLSPDGKLVALASWTDPLCRVLNIDDGQLVREIPAAGLCQLRFSPDGKWLATTCFGGELWDTSTWEKVYSLEGVGNTPAGLVLAFSPDSQLLAWSQSNALVRLFHIPTGRLLVSLAHPHQHRANNLTFSSDGRRLIASSVDRGGAVHVWDLTALRYELSRIGLDWHEGPIEPLTQSREPSIQVALQDEALIRQWESQYRVAELAKISLLRSSAGQWEEACDALRQAVEAVPTSARARNELAWLLLMGPTSIRDPDEALQHARRAVELDADHASYINTLAVALYRNELYREAIPYLQQGIDSGYQGAIYDRYFMAMCHARLGEADVARQHFDDAEAWMNEHRQDIPSNWLDELQSIRAEAAALLVASDR